MSFRARQCLQAVVRLPQPPDHLYPDAVLGGDLLFRGKNWNELVMR